MFSSAILIQYGAIFKVYVGLLTLDFSNVNALHVFRCLALLNFLVELVRAFALFSIFTCTLCLVP